MSPVFHAELFSSEEMSALLLERDVAAGISKDETGEHWAIRGRNSEYFIDCVPTDTGVREDIALEIKLLNDGRRMSDMPHLDEAHQEELAVTISNLSTPTSAFRLFVRVYDKELGLLKNTLCVGSPEDVYRALLVDALSIFAPFTRMTLGDMDEDLAGWKFAAALPKMITPTNPRTTDAG